MLQEHGDDNCHLEKDFFADIGLQYIQLWNLLLSVMLFSSLLGFALYYYKAMHQPSQGFPMDVCAI